MYLYLVIIPSLVIAIESFEVPQLLANVTEDKNSAWFWLPEDNRISSVLYYTNYGNDSCPAYNYKSDPKLILPWAIKKYINESLKISAIVQTKQDEIFAETYRLKSLGSELKMERVMQECHLPPKMQPRRLNSGNPIFSEFFDNNNLDNWFHVVQSQLPAPHYEGVAFVKNKANSFLHNNKLHILVTKSDYSDKKPFYLPYCTSKSKKRCGRKMYNPLNYRTVPPFVSAKLRSRKTFSYCRIEIEAKMPIGDLLFPGLNLVYDDGDDTDDAIRIAIVRGNERLSDNAGTEIGGSRVFAGAIYMRNGKTEIHEEIQYTIQNQNHFGKKFHTYSVIWHEKKIVYKVDGRTIATITGEVPQALSGKKRHIELFVTVGGEHNFPDFRIPPSQKNYRNWNTSLSSHVRTAVEMAPIWKQPRMVIRSIQVYSTDESEN